MVILGKRSFAQWPFSFPMKEVKRSLDVFKLMGKLVLDGKEQFEKDVNDTKTKGVNLAESIGKALSKVAQVGAAAIGACATAVGALTKESIESYAEYEQLVGGSQLLFGDAYEHIAKKAKTAYKDVQMSQNDYLKQVNGFATGLKTALGGNEQAAAELATKIIEAEADVVAATGNSQEAIQNAFNGIMKSNFTMLDNLQLGITPTKEGFQEVIDKVNDYNKTLGNTTKYQIDNLADCQAALVDYIKMQGLAGYASNEAAGTIQGSLAMTKSAWKDLVTGMSDANADMETLIDNFVESTTIAAEKILETAETALNGAATLVEELLPIIVEKIPEIIIDTLPQIVSAAVKIVESLIQGISENQEKLTKTAFDLIVFLAERFLEMLPEIIKLGLDLIVSLATGIAQSLPELIPSIIGVINQIVETLTNEESLSSILDSTLELILALAEGFATYTPDLIDACFELIEDITEFLLEEENIDKIVGVGTEIVSLLAVGLGDSIGTLAEKAGELAAAIVEALMEVDWLDVGWDIISGIGKGLFNGWSSFETKHPTVANAVMRGAESAFYGTGNSLGGFGMINGTHATGLENVPFDGYIAELHKGEMVLTKAEAEMFRSSRFNDSSGEISYLLNQILVAIEAGQVIKLNEREFGRAVKSYA